MRRLFRSSLAVGFALLVPTLAPAADHGSHPDPADAQTKLEEGNARFAAGESTFPRFGAERRQETAENGQHPFATVITCSDSRVPAEVLFDQGIGDVFVIRVAGNVCDTDEIGSIEYGVEHLGTPIMVVLGHTSCGAVTAVATGAEVHGSIPPLVDNIEPAVADAREAHPDLADEALVPHAIEQNVWQSIEDLLKGSSMVRARAADGRVKVVGAVYDIGSGRVEWLGEHPDTDTLVTGAEHHGHHGHDH
jgi:carbonic anhydrase